MENNKTLKELERKLTIYMEEKIEQCEKDYYKDFLNLQKSIYDSLFKMNELLLLRIKIMEKEMQNAKN